ncbi:hypothetical protein ScalyP_jg12024, partial [Parmales sp. scaly parma]
MRMLSANPTDRFQTMDEVLSHPFFSNSSSSSTTKLVVDEAKTAALERKIESMQREVDAGKVEATKLANLEKMFKKAVAAKRKSITDNEDTETKKEAQEEFERLKRELEEAKEKAGKVDQLEKELAESKTNGAAGMMREMLDLQKQSMAQAEVDSKRAIKEMAEMKEMLEKAEKFHKRLDEKTTKILRVSEETQQKLDQSTSSILKGMLEIQITCPTSYVILPT